MFHCKAQKETLKTIFKTPFLVKGRGEFHNSSKNMGCGGDALIRLKVRLGVVAMEKIRKK